MKSIKVELSTSQFTEINGLVKLHLGADWTFAVQDDARKTIYGFPDFGLKRIVLCQTSLDKFGSVWGRRLAFNMIATQIAVRQGGKPSVHAVKRAYEAMEISTADRMPVRLK